MQKMTFDEWLTTGGEIYGSESVWNAAYRAALLDAAEYFKATYNEIWTGAAVNLRLRNIADYTEPNAKVRG